MAKKAKQASGGGKAITIACKGAAYIAVEQLTHFQGNLKSLSNADYERLKKQVLDLGFSEPVGVWQHEGTNYILSGHQRCRVVKRMKEEGYDCPPLPVSIIEAGTVSEAKRKVLALTSQYGKLDKDGLYEFVEGSEIEPDELFENFRFPEVDLAAFTEEYFVEPTGDDLDVAGAATPPSTTPGHIPTPDAVASLGDAPAPTSGVKMVQLFFSPEQHKEFMDRAAQLAAILKTENITDTVLTAMRTGQWGEK